jgi:hypothetical protein
MAKETEQGGEINPLALAGGIPAAEGLAASASMLSNISGTLMSILRNPILAAGGVEQLSRRWDEHVIKRLKEIHGLTGKSAEAFERLARSGENTRAMFARMEGFAMGAGLRIAYLNEQLERQAATVTRYARLQDLAGGSQFAEARRMQTQYYQNVAAYGKEFAGQMQQAEMQLNTSMYAASGITTGTSRANYAKAIGMYNQMYGGNAGGFAANLFSRYRSRGMTLGKAQDLLEQLRLGMEGGRIYNEGGLPGVQQEFLQLASGLGATGMGYRTGGFLSGAANLMQTTRGMGSGQRQDIYSMMQQAMLSGSQISQILSAGLGTTPLRLSAKLQKDLLENPEEAVRTVALGIKNMVQKAGGPQSETGRYFMQQLGIGTPEQLEFWINDVPKAVQNVDKLNVAFDQLSNSGRRLGPEMQKTAEEASDFFDKVSGWVGEKATDVFTSPGMKTVGYGLTIGAGLYALTRILRRGRAGGALTSLLGLSALQRLAGSPDVIGAGGEAGGGMDLERITGTAIEVATIKSLLGRGQTTAKASQITRLLSVARGGKLPLLAKLANYSSLLRFGAVGAGVATLLLTLDAIHGTDVTGEVGIRSHMEAASAAPSAWKDPITKSFEKQRRQAWLDNLISTPPATPTGKVSAIDLLGGASGVQKLNVDPYGNPLPVKEGEAGVSGSGGTAGVIIQIVGPGGEDLGKAIAEQGKQVTIKLSAGQVLGVQ